MQNLKKDKIESMLGFAVKANKLVYGMDAIKEYRKRIYLIFVSFNASENSKKEAVFVAKLRNIPLIVTKTAIEDIIFKPNCKIIALKDTNMAKEIIKYTQTENFKTGYELI